MKATGSILIVDDQLDNLRLLTQLLSEHGFVVRAAKNGHEALAYIQSSIPDIVLLDVKMPDMDGYDVCTMLKSKEGMHDVPVIFISALTEDITRGFETGGVDYITKPFKTLEVLTRVQTHIEMRQMRLSIQQQSVGLKISTEKLLLEINKSNHKEVELKIQNTLLSSLIDSQKETIIFSLDKNYCYTTFNERHRIEMKRVWSVDIKLGMSLLDCMLVPELKNLAKHSIDKALRGEVFSEIRHQPDADIYYEFNWNPIYHNKEIIGVTGFIRDITERTQAHEKLRISEEKFRNIFELSTVGKSLTNIDGKFSTNKTFCDIVGYSSEELENLKWQNITHPDDIENDEKIINSILSGEKTSVRWEKRYIHKNGNVIWVDISTTLQRDKKGNPLYFITTINDLTKRKQDEEEKSKLLNVIENSLNEIYIFDSQTLKFKYINNGALKNIGFTQEEMNHLTPLDIKPEFTEASFREFIFPLLKKEKERHIFQTIHRRKDGSTYPVEVYLQLMIIGNENLFLAVINDITERMNAEEALRVSEHRLRRFYESGLVGVIYWNMNGKITDANDKFLEMTGYTREDLATQKIDWLNMTPPEYRHLDDLSVAELKATGVNKKPFEKEYIRKDGTRIPILLAGAMLDEKHFDGVAFILDITERKQAELSLKVKQQEIEVQNEEYQQINEELTQTNEELLVAKKRAEESDRLKTAFLQNMSHEIRTPMNSIMGFSALLPDEFNNKPKLKQFSEIINQRCHDLLDIVNEILDISKIESGQLPVNFEECNINSLFNELSLFFKEHQKRFDKGHIELNVQAHCDPSGSLIITDKVKLKQILINLISNAFKFTEVGKIEAGCKLDVNHKLLFYVSDTGIGVPLEKQNFIFERFSQLQQANDRLYGGTGLGLSIVKGLIELLGGKIWIESELENLSAGKVGGTTFYFSFPYKTVVTHESYNTKEFEDFKFNGQIVLIVEDDIYNTIYLKEILSNTGLRIIHTSYGSQAIQISLTEPLNLVLMDVRLPDIDGYEATRQIKQQKPGLKIIAQTAYAAHDDKRKAFDAGCDDYISKPVKRESLLSMIQAQLGKNN
jgi:PAS domain S-box-containing protein